MSRRGGRQQRRVGSGALAGSPEYSFVPTSRPGCSLWLRADLGITLATGISAWVDQSASGIVLNQLTTTAQPTLNAHDAAYGGQPTVSFASAASQFLQRASGVATAQPCTMIVVGQAGVGGAQQDFCAGGGSLQFFASANVLNLFAGTTLPSAISVLTPLVMAGIFNGGSSEMFINSSAAPVAGPAAAGAGTGTVVIIGSSGSGAFLNGKIAEVIWYSRALPTDDLHQIFQYLGARYGFGTA